MKMIQKIIKYLAFALAGMIILSIFYGLFSIFLIDDKNDDVILNNNILDKYYIDDLERLSIELNLNNLIIKRGNKTSIETSHPRDFYINEKDNGINISSKKILSRKSTIIITVPDDFVFESIKIEGGAGKINLSDFITRELSLELGAGEVNINGIEVTKETDIDGGAGKISITNSKLSNLDFAVGVGKCTMEVQLYDRNEIEAGIGQLEIKLLDGKENYTIIAEKGIGNIMLDDDVLQSNIKYGNGSTFLEINGGIGSITID